MQKCFCSFEQIFGILDSGSFIWRMHCQLRESDIYGIECNLCVGNIAQCGAACHVGTVGKCLIRNICLLADILEHSGRNAVCAVFLVGVIFDDDSFI